ncbi:hypothetical protein KAF25_006022 [Fusarium avenaceum]|uniref:C2H2-type domain-containing protein n=1 Tax=Fusarium avenaceum TaxID=40199 RepID=A0A9P7GWC5_9HYPO|nr:hypothetical protein KAF25_006022 [Fusarium avenaceum]
MTYCQPCDRYFRYESSLDQHLEAKHSYTYCFRCERHFVHEFAKRQHIANSSQHHVCTHCHSEPDYKSESDLDEHREHYHHACLTCARTFNSHSNLINHLKVHARKEIECLGCTRMFISYSAMMLHLEADTCESGANLHVVRNLMAEYHDLHWYSPPDYDDDLECNTCDRQFQRMSALLQHVESENCDASISDYMEVLDYIEKKICDNETISCSSSDL